MLREEAMGERTVAEERDLVSIGQRTRLSENKWICRNLCSFMCFNSLKKYNEVIQFICIEYTSRIQYSTSHIHLGISFITQSEASKKIRFIEETMSFRTAMSNEPSCLTKMRNTFYSKSFSISYYYFIPLFVRDNLVGMIIYIFLFI